MTTKTTITLVPGSLEVVVYTHDFQEFAHSQPCTTLVSNGLLALGQRELVLSVLQSGSVAEDFVQGALKYVRSVLEHAIQGRTVDTGDVSTWEPPGPVELGDFAGVTFVDPLPLADIEIPPSAL